MDPKTIRVYSSVYSGIQVLEAMVRGIAVMKRKSDGYVNATQILKVAGVDKGKRTKILEKDITNGEHEKIQGGYGKYQGTWIPLERGRDLAHQYGVAVLLAPILETGSTDYLVDARPPPSSASVTQKSRRATQHAAASSLSHHRGSPGISNQVSSALPDSAIGLLNRSRNKNATGQSAQSAARDELTTVAFPEPEFALRSEFNGASQKRLRRLDSDRLPGLDHAATETTAGSGLRYPDGDAQPPAKKARVDQQMVQSGLNGVTSFSTLARQPDLIASDNPVSTGGLASPNWESRQQAVLLAVYSDDNTALVSALSVPHGPNETHMDLDFVVDEEKHTALHWAAALARQNLVEDLVRRGADVNKGNSMGETALIRAVKSANNYEQQTFHALLSTLGASWNTLDDGNRSVLHHVVYLAGVKGRASAARYYMQVLFEYVARRLGGDYRSLVDIQDLNGDTALNVAARIGTRALVRMLLDVGANRMLPNKLGLRPGDFGIEEKTLQQEQLEDAFSSLRTSKSAPLQRSNTIISGISAKMEGLTSEFAAELQAKQDAIHMNQVHLRAATRQLAEQRRQIQAWQAKCVELDQARQRIRNVQKALLEEDHFDWTGPTEVDVKPAEDTQGPESSNRGNMCLPPPNSEVDVSFDLEPDPPIPSGDTLATLARLRQIKAWSARTEKLLEERLARLQGASAEKEVQCKKIVSLCTNVPVDDVEQILEPLLIAVESDSDNLDLDRVSGFLAKVRNGNI